jgi:polyisoprenoid-binding protein YceI
MTHRRFAARLVPFCALAAMLAPTLTGAAAAATWEIDPAHSSVEFSVRHMTISNVRGEFEKFSGTVVADEANPGAARIEATIDAASIDTRNQKRDDHLRSADFLEVEKYPTITFRSTQVEKLGDARWRITGDLTLHGVTREVALEMDGPTPPVKDPSGALRAGAQARGKIDRKDFGIHFSKALDGGGLVVGNEVAITIEVEVKRRPEPVAAR